MQVVALSIHNFRSIKDLKIDLHDYTALVGGNNAGKSNVLTALRIFYEDDISFDEKIDFPKFQVEDNESWIDITFILNPEEYSSLKKEYQGPNNILRVRKYLRSEDKSRVKSGQSNIYAYEDGKISPSLFYGAKNISQAKLGSVIFIPEVSKTEDTLKLSGPSPLRNTISFVMKKIMRNSASMATLDKSFHDFNQNVRTEASQDGFSLNEFSSRVNNELSDWGIEFNLSINPIRVEDIIKNLLSHSLKDRILEKEVDVRQFGQGFQRHLIYTLIKLAAEYVDKPAKVDEFSPNFTLILFEEPEAFLHPQQQELLNYSLRSLANEDSQQILITTHSPTFVSKNIEEIVSLVKIKKSAGASTAFQLSQAQIKSITEQNSTITQCLKNKLSEQNISAKLAKEIRRRIGETSESVRLEEESIRYMLWLDSERCLAFFADIVLICEGATEKVLIDYLIKNKWNELRKKRIYVLDAIGKFNIHRYMNLFRDLGIDHSVLADRDENEEIQETINEFILQQQNPFAKLVDYFDKDIEAFLSITPPPLERRDKKPLNVMWHYFKDNIPNDRIDLLKNKVTCLLEGKR